EVHVPDPRHVLTVRDRVVQRDDEDGGDAGLQRPDDLVRPGGVLDEEQDDGLAARANTLEPPERRTEPRETVAHVDERGTGADGEGRRGARVVDVVETRESELQLDRPLWGRQLETRSLEPAQLDPARCDVEWRAPRAATSGHNSTQTAS